MCDPYLWPDDLNIIRGRTRVMANHLAKFEDGRSKGSPVIDETIFTTDWKSDRQTKPIDIYKVIYTQLFEVCVWWGSGGIFDIRTLGFPSTFSIGYVRKRLRFRILTSVWITTSMENLLENLMLWKMKNIDVAKLELTGRPHNCNNKQQHTTHAYSLL